MDKEKFISGHDREKLYREFLELHNLIDEEYLKQFNRSLPLNETFTNRWERAKKLGFGEGSSIYDSALFFGDTVIGKHCWIGPFTIIDGSGGLRVGDYCTISTGVHIYTHDNLKQTLSGGKIAIEREKVTIGSNVYIGPQSIITKGISIGNCSVIAANSFVNKNVEDFEIVAGNPAKKIGKVVFKNETIQFEYD